MTKPGSLTYLFGNPLVLLATLGATGFFGYQWWTSNLSVLPAVVAFLAFCQSMRATDQLQKYNAWKRDWEAMGGQRPTAPKLTMQSPLIRFGLGIPAWCFGAYLVMTAPDEPGMQIAKACFWLGSVLGVVSLLYRNLPRRRANLAAGSPAPVVSLCIGAPRMSPSVAESRSQLPDYCRALLS